MLTAVSFLKTEENVVLAIFLLHHEVYGKMFIFIIYLILADGIANCGCLFEPLE